jgi:hypothetical protein
MNLSSIVEGFSDVVTESVPGLVMSACRRIGAGAPMRSKRAQRYFGCDAMIWLEIFL